MYFCIFAQISAPHKCFHFSYIRFDLFVANLRKYFFLCLMCQIFATFALTLFLGLLAGLRRKNRSGKNRAVCCR